MKRFGIILTGLFFAYFTGFGQVIYTIPDIPYATQPVSIRFDVSKETGDLHNFTGALYAHTGVNLSDGSNWQYVIGSWGNNDTQPVLNYVGNYTFDLTFTPDLFTYYGVPTDKKITQIAIVIRSADATKQTQNYYVDIFEEGLNLNIISPVKRVSVINMNENITVSAASSFSDTLAIYQDGTFITGTGEASISHTFTGDALGEYEVVLWTANDQDEIRDTIYYIVQGDPLVEELPSGIVDGINYTSASSVTLCLYAPNKEFVYVIGDFSGWEMDQRFYMKKTPDGNRWWLEITDLEPGKEYAFQYYVDEEIKIGDPYTDKVLDPYNDYYIGESTYPGLVSYPEKAEGIVSVFQTGQSNYSWQVTDFQAPSKEKLVIYELLLRDFISNHDWKTLTDTLNYLVTLGVNAIELMPFNEFEGNESWGYNPSYFFAPDKYYGPKDDLKKFVDACHQNGIAVIMDIVLNHAMGQCPFSMLYWDASAGDWGQPSAENPWFNTVSPNPVYYWGSDFNHESAATKRLVDSVSTYWLTQYNVDGFRFDFTKGFTNTSGDGWNYDAPRIAILKRMADHIWRVKPEAYIILEHFADNNEEKVLSDYGLMLWGNVNYRYNQASMGYSTDSDFSYGVSYKNRGWTFPGLVGYMESHDEERLMYKNLEFGNASGTYNVKKIVTALQRMELTASFFIPVPGPKMIWQFGELGYDYSIEYNGRVGNKPIRWDYLGQRERYRLYQIFSALIRLKKEEPAFSSSDYTLYGSSTVKRIEINHESMDVRIIGNFDVTSKSIDPAFSVTGYWYDYFSGDSIDVSDVHAAINLGPGEYHIYTTKRFEKPDVIDDIKNSSLTISRLKIYPNPASDWVIIEDNRPIESIQLYDLNGRLIKNLTFNNKRIELSLVDLSKGIYICNVKYSDGSRGFSKLIKD